LGAFVAKRLKNNGFSLIELLVVLGVVAALAAIAIPSIKAMQKSFDSTGAEGMISAALSTARTIAISQQRYAGVRFQNAYDANQGQYMIFVINQEAKLSNVDEAFCAIEGYKPIKLPANSGLIDLYVRNDTSPNTGDAKEYPIQLSDLSNYDMTMNDISTFSIVFSPSGKIVKHDIRIKNVQGKNRPLNLNDSDDKVFNSPVNIVDNQTGLFVQDDYGDLGYGGEKSRNKFYLYDKTKLNKLADNNQQWDYLQEIYKKPVCLNPYTGEIINKK
ncbi:MAG: prepilin-type N-terminal cleavage/methylation domain-containing protein, partial [Phycisphaerales bacterium]